MKDTYPGPRTFSEAQRLQAQHALVKDALGGLLIQEVDLSKAGLKVLDCGTADGFWLYELRSQLHHPDGATLIGTDIADFPVAQRSFALPDNFRFHRQDIREAWPTEWQGTFDVVHQRAVIANTGTMAGAIKVVMKLLCLVKPGGCIVLVDGEKVPGEILETDPPSARLFKATGNFLASLGLDTTLGAKLPQILSAAIQSSQLPFEQAESTQGFSRIGKDAKPGLEETGYMWIRGMRNSLGSSWRKKGLESPVPVDQIDDFFLQVMEEACSSGIDLPWYATWARRRS